MADGAPRNQPQAALPHGVELLPPMARFILQGTAAARAAAASVWPAAFPTQACRATSDAAASSLWLGPDEYLMLHADAGESQTWFDRIDAAAGAEPHSLVDISHRQCALRISGEKSVTLLNSGCPLDLDLAAFPVGMCTRTAFCKADVVLWRRAQTEFHVEVWRSFLSYVVGSLHEAQLEFVAPTPP
jgi:sarcosine oxidase, subunit gamma